MSLRSLKKVLLSLIVVGALGSITVPRVYAVFQTEGYNSGSTISDGTLTMENTVNTATTCLSLNATSADNANANCDQLFNVSDLMFPGQVKTVNITIKNSGSLNARTLEVWMPSCTKADNPSSPVVHNGGDPCAANGAEFYLQETQSDFTTPVQCYWPNSSTTCGAFGTVANFIDPLGNNYTAAPGLRLYTWLVQNPSPALTATATRYFVIGMELPPTADNSLQGESATFPLTWHMDS